MSKSNFYDKISPFDGGAVARVAAEGPDKRSFTTSTAYYDARAVYEELNPEQRAARARQQLSGGCLLNEVDRGITSATPTECGNDGCPAFRSHSKAEVVSMASACLTDARPSEYKY